MTLSCRSGHQHAREYDVLSCQQETMIKLLERTLRMTETTGETVDQGFADLKSGQDTEETALAALSAEETKTLAFLSDLEAARGTGQLAPAQQAELDDLKARQAATAAALDKAREDLAAADGTEPTPVATSPVATGNGSVVGGTVTTPVSTDAGTVAVPVFSDGQSSTSQAGETPIADSIPVPPAPVVPVDLATAADMPTTPVVEQGDPSGETDAPEQDDTAPHDVTADDEPAPNEA